MVNSKTNELQPEKKREKLKEDCRTIIKQAYEDMAWIQQFEIWLEKGALLELEGFYIKENTDENEESAY